ncbi:heat shock protein 30-like [Scomber scombrus]|uniref:Heat shock protein 30-like n=1 Tax=Scomber scombrus TaxID=13677 RepID=A0AAV1N8J9_SCOSC
MLCSHGFQSALSPLMDFYWPVRCLWPEVKPLLYQQDVLPKKFQELHRSLELMDRLQHKILEETEPFQTSMATQSVSYQLEKEGDQFKLTLDTRRAVCQAGGKQAESQWEDREKARGWKGSYSYRCQEVRHEFDLPEGLNCESVTCYLAPDGKLHIQAAKALSVEEAERELPIKRSLEEKKQQSEFTDIGHQHRERQQHTGQT